VPGSTDVMLFRIFVADLNNGWLEIPNPRMMNWRTKIALWIVLLLAAVFVMLIGLSTAERSVASGPTR
jgi:hypothetical protein